MRTDSKMGRCDKWNAMAHFRAKSVTSRRRFAVQRFFFLSRYLLTGSLTRSPSILRYAVRRFFRIAPAYWVCLVVTSLILAPALIASHVNGHLSYLEALNFGPRNSLAY